MKRVAAVILAAGASTRLREPKQLVALGLENLLERSVRIAFEAGCSPITVVLGAHAELIRISCKLAGTHVVVNESWTEGMGSSIRLGIESLSNVDGAVIMTCDMPAVNAGHLRSLTSTDAVTASSYAGKYGVPAYFPESMFSVLRKLGGDTGARDLLRSARTVELGDGAMDIDTIEDVKAAQEIFG